MSIFKKVFLSFVLAAFVLTPLVTFGHGGGHEAATVQQSNQQQSEQVQAIASNEQGQLVFVFKIMGYSAFVIVFVFLFWYFYSSRENKTAAIVTSVVFMLVGLFMMPGGDETVEAKELTMYKSPNCGCCTNYAAALRREDYGVKVVKTDDMDSVKSEHGISRNDSSCHTIVSKDGYFIEGHVPLAAVDKLFTEKPSIDGIGLPGMPAGSPGMGGMKQGDFEVYSLNNNKKSLFYKG